MLQFNDATELRNHYRNLTRKFQGPKTVAKTPLPVVREVYVTQPKRILSTVPDHLMEQYRKGPVNQKRATAHSLVELVAAKHGITTKELMSPTRKKNIVEARQEAMYRIKVSTGYSILEIARFFNKDHTTILHAISKYERKSRENVQ